MKLTFVFLTAFLFNVSAKISAQKVTLNVKNVTLDKVFREIERQTGYGFLFTKKMLKDAGRVTLDVKNEPVNDVLHQCFIEQPLNYTIENNTIVISRKPDIIKVSTPVPKLIIDINGIVKDEKGTPLAGVSVILKSNNKGTSTDANGRFSIEANAGDVLEFSIVGYQKRSVVLGQGNNINVVMQIEAAINNEIVVVGYGTQKKVNLTGAVSTVSGQILQDRPIGNVGRGLQGQLPGLNITSSDGQPGRGTSFNVRGFTSINGGSPYILVDGVPSDINNINPADVESVTVLKDAAAAAVYGARAPFGVILITTKSGKKGVPKITYSTNYATHHITDLPEVVTDPATVVDYKNQAYAGYYGTNLYNSFYVDYAKKRFADPSLPAAIPDPNNPARNYSYVGSTNWFQELYEPANLSLKHNMSVSGGGDKVSYYFSGGYNQQNGVYRYNPDKYNRYNLRAKLDFNLTKWLTLSTNSAFNRTTYDYPSLWTSDWTSGDLYHQIGRANSLGVPKNPDGSWTSAGTYIGFLKDGGRGNTITNEIQNTLGFTASFLHNTWRIKGDYTFRAVNDFNKKFRIALPYENGPDQKIYYAGHSDASAWSDDIAYQNVNLFTEYENTFSDDHYVKAMIGFNQEENKYDYFSAQNNNLISSAVGYLNQTTGTTPSVGGSGYEWAIRGFFYRLNYSYKQRYLLELNGRYDGSSRFPPNDHYGFFPSASAGWRVSEEPFFEGLKEKITNLKFRASYGLLGNDQSLGNYSFIPTLGSGQASNILGGVQPTAVYPPNLVASTLTWEKVYTRNLGIDISIMNKIDASLDIYRRDTKDMLTNGPQLPAVLGAGQPIENAADLKTLGWEASVGYHDVFMLSNKPFRFNVRLNMWDNHTIISRFNNPNKFWFGGGYYPGQETGSIWGLNTLGIFQTDEEAGKWADESKLQGYYSWKKAGELKYADLNGDGKINYGDGTVDNSGDATVIGNTTPRYSFGGSGGFSWNNIDLSFVFQGVGKKDFWPGTSGYYWSMFFAPYEYVYNNIVGSTWTPANPTALYPSLKGWRAGDAGAWRDLAVPQTRYLYSAAYIRLKNITIGYSLPKPLLKKYGIDQIRFYFSGEDLWESHKLPHGFDPESLGGYWGAGKVYPFQRAYSFGLDLRF